MRIAHYVPSILPALRYGGTERVVYWAAQAQQNLGHQITLLSLEGSHPNFGNWQLLPQNSNEWLQVIEKNHLDVVHFHTLPPPHFPTDFPHIVSIHGNGKPGEIFPINSVFVSQNHATRHGSKCFVHNGLDLAQYPLKSKHRRTDHAIFLSKASWSVKNLRGALKIAKMAQHRIFVAGGSRPLNPWGLLAFHASFQGQVNDQQKIKLLHQSDALLFPVKWQEPFGIAVIEALACGVPVIASPFGSLPEILSPECGLMSTSLKEMAEFLKHSAYKLNPDACRERVEKHFSAKKMALSYIELYQKVLQKITLNSAPPQTQENTFLCKIE